MVQTVVEKATIKYGSFKNLDQSERLELPLVSIIMPAFNAASTIAESILSVLSQTYINWELLIVDDCSTDNTAELARHYEDLDSRIHFFQTPDNSGVAKARNMAIHEAGGRFISFLDSDDIWYPEKLSHQVWFLLENDLPMTYGAYDLTGNGRSNYIFQPSSTLTYNDLLKSNSVGCLTAIYDAEKLGKRYMTITLDRQHDYALWLSICKEVGSLHGIPYPLATYRLQQQSLSSNKLSVSQSHWKVYRFVEGLNFLRSIYYQFHYMVRGALKYRV